MAYRVILSTIAQKELESSFLHIMYEFTNPPAADSFLKDVEETMKRLSLSAESFSLCEDPYLRSRGCHIIHLKKYRYKIIYRISGNDVKIDGVYHNLQNLEDRYKEDYL